MPRIKASPIEQLSVLNELLARVHGSDPEGAMHARRLLDFFREEEHDELHRITLRDCANKLAQMHLGREEVAHIAFAHWHVPEAEAAECSPLWIRQAIVAEMKKLAGRRRALLLVTGLRDAICPEGGYWTQAREDRFCRVREQINELVCAWASRESQLQVIVM